MNEDINLTCRYFQEGWGLGKMDLIYHVIPVNELNEHTPSIKCNCDPKMEIVRIPNENGNEQDTYFIIHKSYLLEQIRQSQNN
jgi:hypothetical protein